MPSIRYVNQSAPFWDFLANLENQGANPSHPQGDNANREVNNEEEAWAGAWAGPWGWSAPGANQQGPFPYRTGPPPTGPAEHEGDGSAPDPPEVPPEGPHPHGPPHEHHRHHGRHGRWGGRGGFGRGRGGGFGRGGPWGPRGGPFNIAALSDFIQSQMFGGEGQQGERAAGSDDFKPECDVFDTEAAYVVHVSLPGAKKGDVAVGWDADKSELSVSGVTHRPGDEDFIKTLALDERAVGAFERKVRLGSRVNPAAVDADGISAKLEDGILVINVPKEDKDFVEVKKIDVE